MSRNAFHRLAALVPESVIYVGRVVALHDDDTSTVELPIGVSTTVIGGSAARGSLIRPRGRTVPVGGWAFVRDGRIENVAPVPAPAALAVGAPVIVTPPTWLIDYFNGAAGPLSAHTSDSGHLWEGLQTASYELTGSGNIAIPSAFGFRETRSNWVLPTTGAFYIELAATHVTLGGIQNVAIVLDDGTGNNMAFTVTYRDDYVGYDYTTSLAGVGAGSAYGDALANTQPATFVFRIEVSITNHRARTFIDGNETFGGFTLDWAGAGYDPSMLSIGAYGGFEVQSIVTGPTADF